MGGKHGVKQLSIIAIAFFEAGEVGYEITSQKLGGLRMFAKLATLTDDVISVANVNVAELKKEAAEIDQADKEQLVMNVANKFDLKDDKLEAKVMATLAHGLDIMQSVQELYKVHAA